MKEIKNSQGLRNVCISFGNHTKTHLMTMRVNGLLKKSQLGSKTVTAYDGTLPHAPVSRSRGTLPYHAPVSRSRARARPQAPPAPRPKILMENTFTNELRLKT